MEGKSQDEMSLNSVVSLIKNISESNESIDKQLKTLTNSDFSGDAKSSDLSYKNITTKIKTYTQRSYNVLRDINKKMSQIINQSYNPEESSSGKNVNITFNGKNVNAGVDFLDRIIKVVNIEDKKYDKVNEFLKTFGDNLKTIAEPLNVATVGLFGFAGAFALLHFVSFTGILKVGTMLVVLGASISFFILSITKSLSGQGSLKSFIIMKTLPDFFIAMGQGVLMLSIGLLLFSQVKGSALTLGLVIGSIIALFAVFTGRSKTAVVGRGGGFFGKMVQFSLALGILVVALYAVKDVPLAAVLTLVGVIIALGVAVRLGQGLGKGGAVTGQKNTPIWQFAIGMGILVLALFAIKEIPFSALFKMIIFMTAFGLTLRLFKTSKSLVGFALGFGILVLAMFAFQSTIRIETMFAFVAFMTAFGLTLKLFSTQGILTLGLLGVGLYLISTSFKAFTDSKFGINEMMILGATIVMLAVTLGIMGLFAVPISLGSATLIGVSLALFLASKPLADISKIDIEFKNIMNFMLSIGLIALSLTMLTPFLLLSLLASLMLIPLGGALSLSTDAFHTLSQMTFSVENVDNFIYGVKTIALGLASVLLPLTLAIPSSVLLIGLMASILVSAGVLKLISMLDYDKQPIDSFNFNVKSIINGINDFGFISLTKASGKALLLLPIFSSMLLGAKMMQDIQNVTLERSKMEAFNLMVGDTVNNIVKTIDGNVDAIENAQPGMEMLGKIFSVGGNIANVVKNMSNLSYDEYVVKNGKLVLKSRNKLTAQDFQNVGTNLGLIIKAMIDPLNMLAENGDVITLGGISFTNPFKSKTSSGIEFVSRLGNAYQPLSESLVKLANTGFITNEADAISFNKNLGLIVSGYVNGLNSIGELKLNDVERTLSQMVNFNKLFSEDSGLKNIETVSLSFERIVNVFSDNKKWIQIRKNLTHMRKEIVEITKSLNSLNIDKATQFEKSLMIIAESNRSDVKELISKLSEFIVALNKNGVGNNVTTKTVASREPVKVVTQQNNNTTNNNGNNNSDEISEGLSALLTGIDNVASILSEEINVKVVNSQNNGII